MAAEQPRPNKAEEAPETAQPAANAAAKGRWRRLLAKRWPAILVVVALVMPMVGFLCFRPRVQPKVVVPPAEVALGMFDFAGGKAPDCCIAGAQFTLAVTLLSQVDEPAREALASRRLRVQQGVEQLLRNAHSGDFDDPELVELKRRMREQIDQSLGMRAISEIIITDLKVKYSDRGTPPVAATAGN